MTDLAFLFELEQHLHTSATRSSAEELSSLHGAEFFEFGSSGKVWSREEILARLPTETQHIPIEATDFKATPLADGVVLVTYVSKRMTPGSSPESFLRSSLWRKNSVGWQMEFHQGTRTSS